MTVNGNVVTELGTKVHPTDEVIVEGQRIKPEKKHYVVLNKPKNFLGTAGDKQGRRDRHGPGEERHPRNPLPR